MDQNRLVESNQRPLRLPLPAIFKWPVSTNAPHIVSISVNWFILPQSILRRWERAIGTQYQLYMFVSGETATQDIGSMKTSKVSKGQCISAENLAYHPADRSSHRHLIGHCLTAESFDHLSFARESVRPGKSISIWPRGFHVRQWPRTYSTHCMDHICPHPVKKLTVCVCVDRRCCDV